jgi:hypothetical protein
MFVCPQCDDTFDTGSPGVHQQRKHWLCPLGHRLVDTDSKPGERWMISIVATGFIVFLAFLLMMTKHSYAERMDTTVWQ